MYGEVAIETKGVEARKTDALECLLALCRVLGLYYEISQQGTPEHPYLVRVKWSNWPVDFFEPRVQHGSFSTCCKDPVDGIQQGIIAAMHALRSNGEQFRSAFMEYWLEKTGKEWNRNAV
jgi:hypothetical protein